ncbi:hypothetical protein BVG19_g5801 [[Candida] boidinii]|nr:hypothetical protein BVG19_g5801 [[Candida] boidinii]OWB54149.1 catalytic activity protein [[Candida] boidinii]
MSRILPTDLIGIQHLKGTRSLGLSYSAQNYLSLTAFCDADWASDKSDRRSTTGYIFQLAGAPITWKSKKQQTVALSTAEAEYMALGDAVKEILWLLQLSDQLKIKFDTVPIIFDDNMSCIELASHPGFHDRTKHIDIRHHFIREAVAKKIFDLEHVDTNNMVADMLTKSLVKVKHTYLRDLAGISLC